MILVLCLGTMVWLGAVACFVASGRASLWHPATFYLLFHGLVFTVRPWLNWAYGYDLVYRVFRFTPSDADRVTALLVADVGLVAFMVAALAAGGGRLVLKPSPARRDVLHRRHARSLLAAAALCVPVGLYALAHKLGTRLADAGTMMLDPATGVTINTSGNGYLADAATMLIPFVVLLPWLYRFRPWSLVPFALYCAARLVDGGGRWTFVMAAASLALAWLYERRALWAGPRLIAFAAAVLGLFTVVGADRAAFRRVVQDRPARAAVPLAPLEGEDYANQEFLEYLVYAVPQRTGAYSLFLDNLQVLTEPVPRALWPGKPIGAPLQRYSLWRFGTPIGMTNALPGEGWAQAGWAGAILWCALFGWASGRAYRWFARSAQTEFQVATYLLLLPLAVQVYRDGTLVSAVRFPLFYLIPLGLWWLCARLNGRRVAVVRSSMRLAAHA